MDAQFLWISHALSLASECPRVYAFPWEVSPPALCTVCLPLVILSSWFTFCLLPLSSLSLILGLVLLPHVLVVAREACSTLMHMLLHLPASNLSPTVGFLSPFCLPSSQQGADVAIFWPPVAKSWIIGRDHDAEKDWRQKEKGGRAWDG